MRKILLLVVVLHSLTLYSQNADINLLRRINLDRSKSPDKAFDIISQTARPFSIAAPIVVFGAGWIGKDKSARQKGLMMGASFIVASAITTTLKYSIKRERPFVTYPEIEQISAGGSPSFPSGHTSDAFSNATSLSMAFPKWYVIAPAYAYASAVGYSRMHLGVHYPSDVIAGAVVGAGSAFLSYKAQKWINRTRRIKRTRNKN
jgi:membrane-associated phospholipid phosphatase